MKVYIGPYVNRWICEIYRRHMEKKYGMIDWPEPGDWKDRQLERIDDAIQWVYDKTINLYIDSKERNIKVRIDDYDTFSMDSTLAHIILPMLKQMKENKHGSPFVDYEDVPENLHPPEGQEDNWENGEIDDNHHERWDYVLSEMIFAFESKMFDWEEQFTTGEYDFRFEKIEDGDYKGYSQMVEGPNHTVKTDWDARKAYQERISKGFLLFGKYYESLWT